MKRIDTAPKGLTASPDNVVMTGTLVDRMLEVIHREGSQIYSAEQRDRIGSLVSKAQRKPFTNPHPTSLFPSADECLLGSGTIISRGLIDNSGSDEGEDILFQLLPYWLEMVQKDETSDSEADQWGHQFIGSYEVSSKFQSFLERIRLAKVRTSASLNSKATQFSRSAHYMGSKAFLAPYLSEIIHTLIPKTTAVVDLMCGSGAASGYFSREWRTLASDAQQFSRFLAKVQGGGLGAERALVIAEAVLAEAREQYTALPECFLNAVEVENDYLSSELTPDVIRALYRWVSTYPRVNNVVFGCDQNFADILEFFELKQADYPYLLFSTYYANLFFGVRQAAEIDCLRAAIEKIVELDDREWALGALICAASSCAYSYGGHFAQPKYDGISEERLRVLAPDLIVSRGLSVSHEFFVRLTSLGEESEKNKNAVELLPGPWQAALEAAKDILNGGAVCVYLDPPYTRDEYSRYYHLLETLVRYDYPAVQDKASMPKRGEAGRFASSFATRNTVAIEDLIVQIIEAILSKGWSCLWSYSSVGVASVSSIIHRVSGDEREIDIFGMDHSYKGQGKHKSKAVREYAVMIRGKG